MRKIIGFKLALRPKEIQRRAKKAKFALEAAGLAEPELQAALEDALKAVKPAVLFDTFVHPDPDQALLSPLPGLAYSLVLAALGPGFEELAGARAAQKPEQAPLWPLIQEHALEECVRFVSSLLADEAAKDSCELSPITALCEAGALEAAVRKLDGSKIGVQAADGRLSPSASTAVSLSWLAKSKAKKGK